MSTATQGQSYGATVSLATTGTVTLTQAQYAAASINLTGTLTGNVTLAFPNVAGFWLVSTASLNLGGNVLTFGSGSGTVTPIAVGQVYVVTCFGSNTIAVSATVGSSVTVAAGTGIGVSGGPAYTVSLTTPVTVPDGGTGLATLTAHDLVVGNGASTPNFLAPGSIGNAPVSNGTDFVSTAIPTSIVAGTGISVSGATGAVTVTNTVTLPTLTNHDLVVGQGTTSPAFVAPGSAGNLLQSNGTDFASAVPLQFPDGTGTDNINFPAKGADTVPATLSVSAQNAFTSASTNKHGGALVLNGGAAQDGTGGPVIQLLGSDSGSGVNQGQILIATGKSNGVIAALQVNASSVGGNGLPWAWTFVTKSVTGLGSPYTFSSAEYSCPYIQLTGSIGANLTLNFPNQNGFWFLDSNNVTFNGHDLLLQSGTGGPVAITSGNIIMVFTGFGGNTILVKQ